MDELGFYDFGPYPEDFGGAENYTRWRRRRRWAMNGPHGLHGYAQYLSGAGGSAMVGAEGAAYADAAGGGTVSSAGRAIAIGVATGVLTFMLNRWLEKVLG